MTNLLEVQRQIEQAKHEERERIARREALERAEWERDVRERAMQEERRAEADRELTERLKQAFFRSNPVASQAEYEKVAERLKEDHFVRMARTDPIQDEAGALRNRHPNDYAPW